MRTAVVRVNVDPSGVLTAAQLGSGMTALLGLADEIGAGIVENDVAAMPANRREVQLLIAADHGDAARQTAIDLCGKAFGTTPAPGVLTSTAPGDGRRTGRNAAPLNSTSLALLGHLTTNRCSGSG